MKLVEILEDDDDVQTVTTNVETSDEVMAAYAIPRPRGPWT
jgi:hypothetical protein